jgi:hypothetical protein
MTVGSLKNKINHSPDGVQVSFTFDFRVNEPEHMVVYEDGTLSEAAFTVGGLEDDSGGEVIFSTPPSGDIDTLTLRREVPFTQRNSYPEYDPFKLEVHERIVDNLTMMIQQLKEEIDRKIGSPLEGSSVDYTLPDYAAGEFWKWDESTQSIITTSLALIGALSVGTTAGDVVQLIDDGAGGAKFPSTLALRSLVEDTSPELGGDLDCDYFKVENGIYRNARYSTQNLGTLTDNTTLNYINGEVIAVTIGADLSFSFSNGPNGNTGILVLEITNGGAYTITWPTSVVWTGGSAPELQVAGTDILAFVTRDGGTTWRGLRSWKEA